MRPPRVAEHLDARLDQFCERIAPNAGAVTAASSRWPASTRYAPRRCVNSAGSSIRMCSALIFSLLLVEACGVGVDVGDVESLDHLPEGEDVGVAAIAPNRAARGS